MEATISTDGTKISKSIIKLQTKREKRKRKNQEKSMKSKRRVMPKYLNEAEEEGSSFEFRSRFEFFS